MQLFEVTSIGFSLGKELITILIIKHMQQIQIWVMRVT